MREGLVQLIYKWRRLETGAPASISLDHASFTQVWVVFGNDNIVIAVDGSSLANAQRILS